MTPTDGKAGFARRLNEAFDRLEIPAKQRGRFTAIGRLFSVSPVAARDWCEGNSYPSVDKLLLIMDTVRCGADWLLFGRSDEVAADTARSDRLPVQAAQASGPRPDRVPATQASAATASIDQTAHNNAAQLQWLVVTGDSMAPTLLAGDQVAIAPLASAEWEDGLYALRAEVPANGPIMLRRVLRQLDGLLALTCDHPAIATAEFYQWVDASCWQAQAAGEVRLSVLGRVVARRHPL